MQYKSAKGLSHQISLKVLLSFLELSWYHWRKSFEILWNPLESFGILWNHFVDLGLQKLESFWNPLESFGRPNIWSVRILWNPLVGLRLKQLESFWNHLSSSELLSSSRSILGALDLQSIWSLVFSKILDLASSRTNELFDLTPLYWHLFEKSLENTIEI